ncbi:MAG TPA: porin family protein [Candidatus Kryptobacter bacterium]|nr:porin family protein [Candidatus Kryptobacter bacterium]
MKELILFSLLILTALLMPQSSNAQVRIGIQGGLSVPDLSGGNNEISQGYTSRLAPNFGISADFGITNNFSIEPQVNFDGQGGQRNGLQPITNLPPELPALPNGDYYYASFNNMSILNYLEIPILVKYTFELGGFGLDVNAGPYVGFLLNATEKTSGRSQIDVDKNGTPLTVSGFLVPPQSFDASTDVTNSINQVNFGIAGGVGIILPVSTRGCLSLDLRGLYGLTNVQKYAQDGTSHTGNLVVSLGYSYELIGI